MRKLITVCLFIFAGVLLHAQTLTWDIKLLRASTQETLPINNRTIRMETGETVVITLTPATNCFAYVLLYIDAEQKFAVGQNGTMKGGEEKPLGIRLEDPPGTVTLSVILSLTRQTELERLIQVYNNNQNYQNRSNLQSEIEKLQDAASGLGEAPSEIISSGATMRGTTEEFATRFTDRNMYVRKITFRH